VGSDAWGEKDQEIPWVRESGWPLPLSVPTQGMRLQNFVSMISQQRISYAKSSTTALDRTS